MSSETYLLIANLAVWGGIGAYLCFLAVRSGSLKRRMKQMEMLNDG